MPELPEVETIRGQLKEKILNKKIEEVLLTDKRLIKGMSAQAFKENVEGKFIEEVLRRGKVLILKLKDNGYLIIHLRISGWLVLNNIEQEKFSRVSFKLPDKLILHFCDSRVLGEIRLVDDWEMLPIVKTMGPEPLELKKEVFAGIFKGKKTKIKPLIMDQTFLAGVGNMYAQESLFCAGIHPGKNADKVTKEELCRLYNCLTTILKEAVDKRGSSVDTYRQINGKEGSYSAFLKVYQREGKPCLKCKIPIKRETIGGRGTYFCPNCQK